MSDDLWTDLSDQDDGDREKASILRPHTDNEILAQIGLDETGFVVLKGPQERKIGRILQDASAKYSYLVERRKQQRAQGILSCELKLIQLLVRGNYVKKELLLQAKQYQEQQGTTFITALSFLNVIDDFEVASLLCEDTEYIFAANDEQHIEGEVLQLVPPLVMKLYQILPLALKDDQLNLGMVNPLDQEAAGEVAIIAQLRVRPIIITESCLHRTLENYFQI